MPASLAKAALAALARINSRLNLKPKQQSHDEKYAKAPERALAAAGEISKLLQQQAAQKDEMSGKDDMDLDKSDDSGPGANGVAPSTSVAKNAGLVAGGAPVSAKGPVPAATQGSAPPGDNPSASSNNSYQVKQQAPPSNAQMQPRAENPPSAKPAVAEPLTSLPLPSPEAPAGEATLI